MARQTHRRLNFSTIAWIIIGGIVAGSLIGLFIGFNIPTEPPPPKAATIIYDANQREIARLFVENRVPISLERIPKTMKDAIISVEDRQFYTHSGINIKSIVRALVVDIKDRDFSQGASTITQQLARNALLSQERTIGRKIKEIFIAFNLERNFTKDEILEKYLNQIYFGHGAWGVESAAQTYFGKHIWQLKLHQYALLAGLPRGPGYYSPYVDRKAALYRRAQVLEAMAETGCISRAEAAAASRKPLDVIPLHSNNRHAAYFVDYLLHEMLQNYHLSEEAIYTQGLQIYTTLDNNIQEAAEKTIRNIPADQPDASGVIQPQGAIVAIDPKTGYIKAMVGGRDFQNTQLNRAVRAYRQPGSAIKPFVYAAALDSERFSPSSVIVDEPIVYPHWAPHNSDGKYRGPISLREALAYSVNIVAIKLVEELGPGRVATYARHMGLDSIVTTGDKNDLNLASMALGGLTKGVTPLELTAAYTPFANHGIYSEPIAILQVRDEQGDVLYENTPNKRVVLREETADLMTDMLRGVISHGTGTRAQIGRPAAGKTGTTSDYTNAWFVGYTPDLVATVWIGNDAQSKPVRVKGAVLTSSVAAGIWGDFMRMALRSTPVSDFNDDSTTPAKVSSSSVAICVDSGMLATPNCPNIRTETFAPGSEPTEPCNIHGSGDINETETVRVDICTDSGGLATVDCPRSHVIHKTFWKTTGKAVDDGTPLPTERCPIHGQNRMVTVRICSVSGQLATPYCPKGQVISKRVLESEQPTSYCSIHQKKPNTSTGLNPKGGGAQNGKVSVRICTESGLLATPYCPKDLIKNELFTEGEEPTGYCKIHKRRDSYR
ncbi:MAG TPA: PBP1A family penicillin-binding protein [Bacillota bacterium]|nr:PBP1A family penicillin-binding protein [Bacillota bacterium]